MKKLTMLFDSNSAQKTGGDEKHLQKKKGLSIKKSGNY
jgi:hypothetical protein